MALLLPALSKSVEASRQVNCAAQQRSIAQAFTFYLPDYNGFYPYANPAGIYPFSSAAYSNWSAATNNPWMMAINFYLGGYTAMDPAAYPRNSVVRTFRCPSNWRTPYATNSQFQPATTYGFNTTTWKLNNNASNPNIGAFPNNWHGGANPFLENPADPQSAPNYIRQTREARLANPGRMLFIGEIMNGRDGAGGYQGIGMTAQNFYSNYIDTVTAGNSVWLPSLEEAYTTASGANSIRVQHNFGWNSLFADSHVEYTTKRRLSQLSGSSGNPLNTPDRSYFWRGQPTIY